MRIPSAVLRSQKFTVVCNLGPSSAPRTRSCSIISGRAPALRVVRFKGVFSAGVSQYCSSSVCAEHQVIATHPCNTNYSSGSSGAGGRGQTNRVSSLTRTAPYQQQAGRQRRAEDASPLMRRDANYAYSDDGDSD